MKRLMSLVVGAHRVLHSAPGSSRDLVPGAASGLIPGKAVRILKQAALSVVTVLGVLVELAAWQSSATAGPLTRAGQPATAEPVRGSAVNRTVPNVKPPTGALAFSVAPTKTEIFRARVFEEPLVVVGDEPARAESASLAAALLRYSQRQSPDDFSGLVQFLEAYPQSSWRASLLLNLGLEYYNTAHYSLALEAWSEAWSLAKSATDAQGKAVGDRAAGELAYMYARIGRMKELASLLQSVERRVFLGPATERISGARAGLDNMKNRPEIAFRCGPLALVSVALSQNPASRAAATIHKSASTQQGFSLPQVAALAKEIGLSYQMAFREKGAAFVMPSVIHWKVGHYAALIRQEGDLYLLKDPTFQNDVWATREALDSEASGYFLIPQGPPPRGWRAVEGVEGAGIWGKGNTCCNDPNPSGCKDPKKDGSSCDKPPCKGMAVASVHLMLVSLNIVDTPVGYLPPVGPTVDFTVTYNHREANQPSTFSYSNLGSKWTMDWLSYITDSPFSPSGNVKYYIMGGGTRIFTGFDTNTQTFASQQFDQTLLKRTSAASYELLSPDGSKAVFSQSDGSAGSSRRIFLTQLIDRAGNAVSLTYDSLLRIVALTDAIGQVTTLSYDDPIDLYKITKVTDPFGRFATFDYDPSGRLIKITDVIGLTSQFIYDPASDYINSLITPYGTNTFIRGESGTTRWLETIYPTGEHDRVEYNQSTTLGIAASVPASSLPTGMATHNDYLWFRNTYYWSRNAYASAYPDSTKAKIYHWLHTIDQASTSGILESTKEPLEGRVWYDYAGQSDSIFAGINNKPTHVGRVLDDGTTQLYTYEYDGFGHVTRSIDPVGRTLSYLYSTNGIDLLEVRQTRAGNNELLSKTTYNAQHLPLTITDAAGQSTTFTYNGRGQILTQTDPKGQTVTYTYDPNGFRLSADGRLPGASDVTTATYDALGRVRSETDVSGYRVVLDYDALDRITRITFPDGTFDEFRFDRLDPSVTVDRAGRATLLEYNPLRQLAKRTDPLGRVTLFQWCKCGDTKSLTDPMGRTTTWHHDVQGRVTEKQFADGSKISYIFENTRSRIRQVIDEKAQVTQYGYNKDDSLSSVSYGNTTVPCSPVLFTYDPSYPRAASVTDGTGTTLYTYIPVTSPPMLGAGQLAAITGPLPNSTIALGYDELGRRDAITVNGITSLTTFDPAGRVIEETNALGDFNYAYDGPSSRVRLEAFPNGQTNEMAYGDNLSDLTLQRITHRIGTVPVSEFLYTRDVAAGRINSWSQQAGTQTPSVSSITYDVVDQVAAVNVTNAGALVGVFGYTYDVSGNRQAEQIGASSNTESYNTLNQLTSTGASPGASGTNEWDAEHRLTAVNVGSQRTEFTYDGVGRLAGLRKLTNGSEVSNRRFLWLDNEVLQELTVDGQVSKRFFNQGVKVETGSSAGRFYYTRDHLGSIRELTDGLGNVRARYNYDPFGRRTRLTGDLDTDFGFAGMLLANEAGLYAARFRIYDPELGRWLSRDPLQNAETQQGSNLYTYVANNPINLVDHLGLCCEKESRAWQRAVEDRDIMCVEARQFAAAECALAKQNNTKTAGAACALAFEKARARCEELQRAVDRAAEDLKECYKQPCGPPSGCPR